jgi:hypothetical protein
MVKSFHPHIVFSTFLSYCYCISMCTLVYNNKSKVMQLKTSICRSMPSLNHLLRTHLCCRSLAYTLCNLHFYSFGYVTHLCQILTSIWSDYGCNVCFKIFLSKGNNTLQISLYISDLSGINV